MKKKSYLESVTLWARWCLPKKEADEVTADYKELLAEDSRSEQQLLKDFGTPYQAVRPLTRAESYRGWLVVFAVLAACGMGLGWITFSPWAWDNASMLWIRVLWGVGLVISLVWFWRKQPKSPLPKGLVPMLFPMPVLACAALGISWWLVKLFRDDVEAVNSSWILPFCHAFPQAIEILGLLFGLLVIYALVKARISDRRWAAVYAIGMTSLFVLANLTVLFTSLDNPEAVLIALWRHNLPALAGVVVAGVFLC